MRKILILATITFISNVFVFSQQTSTFIDPRDGKKYKTVQIGKQVILAENYAYKPATGNYWAYNNDTSNVPKYGYLYDFETARKIAPVGWHLPSTLEWNLLINNMGKFKSDEYRYIIEKGQSGVDLLMGGYRYFFGAYFGLGSCSHYWSSSVVKNEEFKSYEAPVSICISAINCGIYNSFMEKECGLSVRLIKDY